MRAIPSNEELGPYLAGKTLTIHESIGHLPMAVPRERREVHAVFDGVPYPLGIAGARQHVGLVMPKLVVECVPDTRAAVLNAADGNLH